MKKLSFWANQHIYIARLLLVLLHGYLILSAFVICNWLINHHLLISWQLFAIVMITSLVIITAIHGFKKYLLTKTSRFLLGKTKIAVTAICCFVFIITLFNNQQSATSNAFPLLQGNFILAAEKIEKPQLEHYTDKNEFYKDLDNYYRSLSKQQLKKELRNELKDVRKKSVAVDTLFVLLILVGAIIALFGVAVLACGIACSGSGALAVIVSLLGGVGIIWLAAYLIIKVTRKKEKEKPEPVIE